MNSIGLAALSLTVVLATVTPMRQALRAPLRILHLGHRLVNLPFTRGPVGWSAIERAALKATEGGQVVAIRPSVFRGQAAWMCTISRGGRVWHVMVNRLTGQALAKMMLARR